MRLKDMTKADLELLSNYDIAALLLKENKKPMNTPSLFKEICSLLGYTDDEYTEKIGEFYTSMTTDKRFVLLDTAEWDLRDNHAIKFTVDEDEDEEIEVDEEPAEDFDESPEASTDIEEPIEDDDLDIDADEDDMEDLTIVDEEEIEP